MGGGKSSGSTQVQMTPEQTELLKLQTGALRDTFLPAYEKTVTGAKSLYETMSPTANTAATDAAKLATSIGSTLDTQGTNALKTGVTGLTALFDPNYECWDIVYIHYEPMLNHWFKSSKHYFIRI